LLETLEAHANRCRVGSSVLEGLGDWSCAKASVTEEKQPEQIRQPDGAPPRKRDGDLVDRLREGDQRAFLELFRKWHPSMVRVALNYVRGRSVAEEVAQETWLHFMQQLGRFGGRSSLKTWTFRILVNRAINRGKREHRAVSLVRDALTSNAPGGQPGSNRLRGTGPLARTTWASGGKTPRNPEQNLLDAETRARLEEAIRGLPEKQKLVLTLRDVQGWCSADVCELLEISPENQRVILHRARVQVRNELAGYLERR
jgi:RNA polymerase sigma-70 factor (ECF subfamily)